LCNLSTHLIAVTVLTVKATLTSGAANDSSAASDNWKSEQYAERQRILWQSQSQMHKHENYQQLRVSLQ